MFFRRYAHLFQWLFIVDEQPFPGRVSYVLKKLPKGSLVLLRAYCHPHRKSIALWLSGLCRTLRLLFLVGGDSSLASTVKASGIHLREADFNRLSKWKHLNKRRWFITSASHSVRKNIKLDRAGFDAALFSPVFESKNPTARPIGPIRFAKYHSFTPKMSIFALGGTSRENIWQLRQSRGKASIAGISLYNAI